MNRRLRLLLALLALCSLFAAACGDDDDTGSGADETTDDDGAVEATPDDSAVEATPDDGAAEEAMTDDEAMTDGEGIRIAIVAPSAANDLAFTQSIVDGVDRLDGVGEVAISEGLFNVEDAATALRDYATEGYDLVIAHGSQYGAPLEQIAAEFPDTAFAWGTAVDTFGLPNVSAYTTAADQGAYVLGVVAASLGDNIGIVGPIEVGDAKLYVDGFKLGAEAGGATVAVTYTDNFGDVALASAAADAFVSNGATILTGTAQMTVGAIAVAEESGLLWFGTQSDQTSAAADGVVAANQVYHWEVALQPLLDDIASGILGGNTYELTLDNGGLTIEYGNWDVPAEVTELVDTTIAEVIAGDVVTTVA